MNRDEIMERVAEWFEISPDEDGTFDIDSYTWQAGCYLGVGGKWLNLAEVVYCIESIAEDFEEDYEEEEY